MRTAALRGQVTEERGQPLSGARLDLDLLCGSTAQRIATLRSDPSGNFRSARIPAGAYRVRCGHAGMAMARATLWVADGETPALQLALTRGVRIAGQVVDDRGRPVRDARVRASPAERLDLGGGEELAARSDAKGGFAVDGLKRGSLYLIEASAPSHGVAAEPEVEAPAAGLRLRLVRLYELKGAVQPRRKVTLQIAGSGLWPARKVPSAPDGSFSVDRIPAGVYELVARSADPPWVASDVLLGIQVGPEAPAPVTLPLRAAQRITGRVTHDGAPIPAAVVTLGTSSLSALQNRATTTAQGEFALEPVPDGVYQASVWAKGFLPDIGKEIRVPVQLPLMLSLNPGVRLEGTVVDEDGREVSGAFIWLSYRLERTTVGGVPGTEAMGELGVLPGPVPPIPSASAAPPRSGLDPGPLSSSMGLSDRTGRFVLSGLQVGTAQVVADHPSYQQARSPWIRVGGSAAPPVRLMMRAGALISGQTLDERGMSLDSVQVVASCAQSGSRVVLSDRNGRYAVTGMAGRVTVSASRQGYTTAARAVDLRGRPRVEVDLVLEPAQGGLSGTVYDPSHLPVARARVTAQLGGHRVTGTTSSTGAFELLGIGRKGLALRVEHPDYVPAEVQVAPDTREVDVHLRYRAAVSGQVQDTRTGAPVFAYTVVVEGSSPERRVPVRSPDGRFVLSGVVPGEVRLRVEAAGFASETKSMRVGEPDRLRGAGTSAPLFNFDLQHAGTIEGQVSELSGLPVAGATASVGRLSTLTSAAGAFKLDRVPEGNHVVEVRLKDGRTMRSDPVVVRADQVTGPVRLLLR